MNNAEFGQVCANRRAALAAAAKLAAADAMQADVSSIAQCAEAFAVWLDEPVRKMREARR